MLYIAIAQSIDIPIFGVDLHHHFALVYMDDTIEAKKAEKYIEDEVLFYIAVVNKGSVFTRAEIKHYLKQLDVEENEKFFLPASNVMVVKKLITQMTDAYLKEGKEEKAALLDRLLSALD